MNFELRGVKSNLNDSSLLRQKERNGRFNGAITFEYCNFGFGKKLKTLIELRGVKSNLNDGRLNGAITFEYCNFGFGKTKEVTEFRTTRSKDKFGQRSL